MMLVDEDVAHYSKLSDPSKGSYEAAGPCGLLHSGRTSVLNRLGTEAIKGAAPRLQGQIPAVLDNSPAVFKHNCFSDNSLVSFQSTNMALLINFVKLNCCFQERGSYLAPTRNMLNTHLHLFFLAFNFRETKFYLLVSQALPYWTQDSVYNSA